MKTQLVHSVITKVIRKEVPKVRYKYKQAKVMTSVTTVTSDPLCMKEDHYTPEFTEVSQFLLI